MSAEKPEGNSESIGQSEHRVKTQQDKAERKSEGEEKKGSWLKGLAWSTWGIIKDTASEAADKVSEAADKVSEFVSDIWNKAGNAVWEKKNEDGSVSRIGIVGGSIVIPPLDEFNWGWSGSDINTLWDLGGESELNRFNGSWRGNGKGDDKGDRKPAASDLNKDREAPEPPDAVADEEQQDHWRRDGGDSHVVRDDKGNKLAEIVVKEGKIYRRDAGGAQTEVTREYVRHETSGGEKLVINKRTGEVFHESADGTVAHSRNGERFKHIDKKRGIIVDGDGRTIYMVERDCHRKIKIDKVNESVEMVESRGGLGSSRLNRDKERLVYTIEQADQQFQFIQDRFGNQYFKDEEGTQYWRSKEGKQTLKTGQGSIYRADLDGRRIYRTAAGQAYRIDKDGTVSAVDDDTAGGITTLSDGSARLPDGTIVNSDGTLILADGTKISADGTVTTPAGHTVKRSGYAKFRDGQSIDRHGFRHRDGTEVLHNGDVTVQHQDGTKSHYLAKTRGLKLGDGAAITPAGTITAEGTTLSVDRSVEVSDGTRIGADFAIAFSDGTMITPDGRVSTPDGWSSSANLFHHGIEFTSEKAASQAAADALELAAKVLAKGDALDFSDINSLMAALGDLTVLARVFTLQGKLDIVNALRHAAGIIGETLSLAIPKAQAAELARRQEPAVAHRAA